MKEVRDLQIGDMVKFDYGIDNRVTAVITGVEVHPTWTKIKAKATCKGGIRNLTTWLYTDALIEVVDYE